jgi:hypothetical protein
MMNARKILLFLRKKKQKDFCQFRLAPCVRHLPRGQTDKSLFASFSSEKEDSSFLEGLS